MCPVRRANRYDRAAVRVGAQHCIARAAFLPLLVPLAIIGMPAGRTRRENLEVLWSAIAKRRRGQAVLPLQLAAIAFVADDFVFRAKASDRPSTASFKG